MSLDELITERQDIMTDIRVIETQIEDQKLSLVYEDADTYAHDVELATVGMVSDLACCHNNLESVEAAITEQLKIGDHTGQ